MVLLGVMGVSSPRDCPPIVWDFSSRSFDIEFKIKTNPRRTSILAVDHILDPTLHKYGSQLRIRSSRSRTFTRSYFNSVECDVNRSSSKRTWDEPRPPHARRMILQFQVDLTICWPAGSTGIALINCCVYVWVGDVVVSTSHALTPREAITVIVIKREKRLLSNRLLQNDSRVCRNQTTAHHKIELASRGSWTINRQIANFAS